ncbi:MAG: DUF899 family protein, partial [Gammaproteobacteria bacterium]|nr:DUF899 family protein [Gammaproteobacteria bacterium]
MSKYHEYRYPDESEEYRNARDKLLAAEIELRRKVEQVARQRRALPPGGELTDDFVFESIDGPLRLSALFEEEQDCLVLYSFMFAPGAKPCPMCTSMLDGLNGNVPQIKQRVSLAVVAAASVAELQSFAEERNWNNLRLLSGADTNYSRDYLGQSNTGSQMPMLNVFMQKNGKIRHSYGTEMMLAKSEDDQDPRHIDMIWPLWNLLDFTPIGRAD